jgi:threonine dehydrogenase-like Zn-dependent dehydrogenase
MEILCRVIDKEPRGGGAPSVTSKTITIWAVQALASGRVNVDPILSAQFPFPDAVKAFELASDRRQAVKVSLVP